MEIPVIGIGAGANTDGQVLVLHDLLDLLPGKKPRFVKEFAHVRQVMAEGISAYAEEVRARTFPTKDHTYPIAPEELAELKASLPAKPRTD
jgi:3-methyl-2-oxobutanoate hydroxymethyltransferase